MKRREFLKNSLVLGGTVLGCAGWVDYLMPRPVIGHRLLRHPGALSESQFLTRCIQCMRCVDSCPNRAIVPYTDAPDRREQGTPVIRARRQAYMLCNGVRGEFLRCTEVCPTGALRRVKKDPETILRAVAMGTAEIDTALCYSYNNWVVHQDGRAGRTTPAQAAEATVLSSFTSADFPHLYALREELRSWRFLQLDPASLRRPSPITASEELEPDGSNLATVLARIQVETMTKTRPRGILAEIAADMVSLIPGVIDLRVEKDERNREHRVDIALRDEPTFSSRVVSDGTLRVLALLSLLHDPKHRGLVCFEEPENGVHPGRLKRSREPSMARWIITGRAG